LRGFLLATADPKLRVAAAEEKASTTSGVIVVVVAHGASTTFTPIVVLIPVSARSVTAFLPFPVSIIISQ
jgi:hypothetical protein